MRGSMVVGISYLSSCSDEEEGEGEDVVAKLYQISWFIVSLV